VSPFNTAAMSVWLFIGTALSLLNCWVRELFVRRAFVFRTRVQVCLFVSHLHKILLLCAMCCRVSHALLPHESITKVMVALSAHHDVPDQTLFSRRRALAMKPLWCTCCLNSLVVVCSEAWARPLPPISVRVCV
jgi:hypothetical protein